MGKYLTVIHWSLPFKSDGWIRITHFPCLSRERNLPGSKEDSYRIAESDLHTAGSSEVHQNTGKPGLQLVMRVGLTDGIIDSPLNLDEYNSCICWNNLWDEHPSNRAYRIFLESIL